MLVYVVYYAWQPDTPPNQKLLHIVAAALYLAALLGWWLDYRRLTR
jgi:hypothetical protein